MEIERLKTYILEREDLLEKVDQIKGLLEKHKEGEILTPSLHFTYTEEKEEGEESPEGYYESLVSSFLYPKVGNTKHSTLEFNLGDKLCTHLLVHIQQLCMERVKVVEGQIKNLAKKV